MAAVASVLSTSPTRIAVVEDDHHLRRDLLHFLEMRGFAACGFHSAEEFLSDGSSWELVLLDVGLPGIGGFMLLERIKSQEVAPAIVLLTAYGTDTDRVHGLNAGADAYVVKGASLEVIEATCRSVLRGRPKQRVAGWSLVSGQRVLATPNGFTLELTNHEATFLRVLMRNPGVLIARETFLLELDKPSTLSNLRNLDNCVARLRKKVTDVSGLALPMRASYGAGYIFVEDAVE